VTAEYFRTPLRELLSHCRTQPLCRRRHIAMYVAHEMTGRSLVYIGRKIGDRDHTTVLHGVRVVKRLLDAGDAETIAAVNQIIERLQIAGGAHD
jgi:chromosomal replication initiator protein